MAIRSGEVIRRWRKARSVRASAYDDLAAAECQAGERRPLSARVRVVLVVIAGLMVVGAAAAVWRAIERAPEFSDRELIDAAEQRVELLLSADAGDQDRARAILSGATGEFHDEFAQSADAYSAFVRQRGSRGDARIDGAALAAREGATGIVLIAATVQVESGGDQVRQQLRLRVVLRPEDRSLKLAGVAFLP